MLAMKMKALEANDDKKTRLRGLFCGLFLNLTLEKTENVLLRSVRLCEHRCLSPTLYDETHLKILY